MLTKEQTALVTDALLAFANSTITRARKIVNNGGVTIDEIVPGDARITYRAHVFDKENRKRPKASVTIGDGQVTAGCVCGRPRHCVHVPALLLTIYSKGEQLAPGKQEKVPKRQRAKANLPPQPVAPPTSVVPAAARPAPKEPVEKRSIIPVWVRQLGRDLSGPELEAADVVDTLFKKRENRFFGESLLNPLTTASSKWTWNTVELWPEPPGSPEEVWLHIATCLRAANRPLLPSLEPLFDEKRAEALQEDWKRNENVEQWRKLLGEADGRSTEVIRHRCLRVRLSDTALVLEQGSDGRAFTPMTQSAFKRLHSSTHQSHSLEPESFEFWRCFIREGGEPNPKKEYKDGGARILNLLLRQPRFREKVVGTEGFPLQRSAEPLVWTIAPAGSGDRDYILRLTFQDGTEPPSAVAILPGSPLLYVTGDMVFAAAGGGGLEDVRASMKIPAEALETASGLAFLERLGVDVPSRISESVVKVPVEIVFECKLGLDVSNRERLTVTASLCVSGEALPYSEYRNGQWKEVRKLPELREGRIARYDRGVQTLVPDLIDTLGLKWDTFANTWERRVGKSFPEEFQAWIESLADGCRAVLEGDLQSLTEDPVKASVQLDISEAAIDWFDIRVELSVADQTFTDEELRILLAARGAYVRIEEKGWKRLNLSLSPDQEDALASIGLNAREFDGESQRLHALQLAGLPEGRNLLPADRMRAIRDRINEIQTRVTPAVPAAINAELRPYQVDGFHFLAYLTKNRFGGVLADDMGLGKTLQTLAWIQWLREQGESADGAGTAKHFLVVCPKSVTENWFSETARFLPGLKAATLQKGQLDADALQKARASAELIILNYAQLRALEEPIAGCTWRAAILDEAQAIKNPESQTARIAWGLKASHRLALSGTPVENRLLDLWSIFQFAMPGVLGNRSAFTRSFDQRRDALARRRLAARVRPFVLRRTKGEVAKDLPDRVEEDIVCELEGEQNLLYTAELKRARAALNRIATPGELDKERFNILTSLLRLRQICCDPRLIGAASTAGSSAKMQALFDLLEPLVSEGHKVLVFSQFSSMLDLVAQELTVRDMKQFILTGKTENRGALTDEFQRHEGAAVFLISLKAGGFGLNLTAASYVVLFDPWWNPAVENQAIDRTHRIGQERTVMAYRLLAKGSIEEKIRTLQRQKSALAQDILGEETFARALSLNDFRFLLE